MPIFDSEYPVPVTGSVQVLNPTTEVTATLGGPVTASVSNFPAGFNSNITASITLPVTGNVHVDNFVTATFPSGFNVNVTASVPLTASVSNLPATQSVWWPSTALLTASVTNFPADQVVHGLVEVTASVPLQVTSTLANPLWVTGTIDVINDLTGTVQVTGNVLVDNFPAGFNVNVTASVTQSVTGSVLVLNPVTTASISNFPAGFNVDITASVTLPVSATNPVTASISNFPAGFLVEVTASVPLQVTASVPNLTASVSNFPTGFNANITASVPLFVTGAVSNFPSKYDTVPLTPNPTQYYPARLTDGTNYYNATGGGSGSGGTTIVVVPPKQVALTGTTSRIPQSVAAASTLLGGNPSARLGFTIFNSSSQGLNVSFSDITAVTAAFKVGPFSTYDSDENVYAGTIYGLWDASGTGAAFVTEYSGQQAITGTLAVTQGSGSANTTLYPWMVTFPSYNMSAFGALRTANPYTLLDLVSKYGIDNFELATSGTGGATISHNANEACIRLQTDGASGSAARIRTNTYFRYQAGRGQRIITTCVHDARQAGQTRQWGYYDTNDGLLWTVSGTDFGFIRRSSTSGAPVDTFISQSAFNLDKFDGTGPSQQNLDITKGNIYEIDFQWLGVGVVNLFINGLPVHSIQNPNTLPTVYMKTAVLPVAATVKNDAVTTSGSGMKFICANVTSEGGQEPPEYAFTYGRSAIKSGITNGGLVPLLAIRLQDVFPSGSTNDNRQVVLPSALAIYAENATANKTPRCDWALVLNPTSLTTPTWVNVDVTNSCVQRDEAATAYSGGTVVASGRFQTNPAAVNAVLGAVEKVDLTDVFNIQARKLRRAAFTGVSDVLVLVCQSTTVDNINADATIQWQEVR